jgi:hypothetical protein
MRRALVVLLACVASARADVRVDVRLTPDGEELARERGLTPDQLAHDIADRVSDVFAVVNVGNFLQTFSDTSAFSARGLGADYSSLPRGVVLGLAVTGAVATSDDLSGATPLTHQVAPNVAAMVGLNLAHWGHPRWTVYANGFYREAGIAELDGNLASGGAHVQTKLIDPQAPHLVRWLGVDVTTGLEVTRWTVGTSRPLARDVGVDGMDLALATTGRLELAATSAAIPVELTTGVRVANALALYAGGAIDFDLGEASVTAQTSGDLRDAGGRSIGTVAITGGESHAGSPLVPRALAGSQLELGQFKLFGQVNASLAIASVGIGIRFVL